VTVKDAGGRGCGSYAKAGREGPGAVHMDLENVELWRNVPGRGQCERAEGEYAFDAQADLAQEGGVRLG
jgi:hypothetical protein